MSSASASAQSPPWTTPVNCEAAISKITYTTPEAEASKVLMATGLATYGVINKDDLAQVYFRSMGVVGTAPLAK